MGGLNPDFLTRRQHNFSRKEVDQVVRDFDNITNMEDTLNRFPSVSERCCSYCLFALVGVGVTAVEMCSALRD